MIKYSFCREQRPATNVLYQEFSFQDNEIQNEIEEVPEITGNFIYFNCNSVICMIDWRKFISWFKYKLLILILSIILL